MQDSDVWVLLYPTDSPTETTFTLDPCSVQNQQPRGIPVHCSLAFFLEFVLLMTDSPPARPVCVGKRETALNLDCPACNAWTSSPAGSHTFIPAIPSFGGQRPSPSRPTRPPSSGLLLASLSICKHRVRLFVLVCGRQATVPASASSG